MAVAQPPPGTLDLPSTLYAGTWGDGVYRNTEHGATWQPANVGITLPIHIQSGLAVNPITPTILYAGDYYGGGLYRSPDGGESWSLSLPNASIRAVAVHPLTPTVVLAGDREEGLYRSTDAGDTWSVISETHGLTDPHIRALAFAPATPNVAYAGAGQSIFYSADAGESWTARSVLSSTIQALAIHPVTPSLVYAGTINHGLHRSADWAATWTRLTNGLPANAWVTSLAVHPISPTILYAGTWEGQVYRSDDGGDSWTGLGHLGHVYSVLVHPTAPSVIYAATSNNGLFRGSTLDHLTMPPVDSPQRVDHSFPITVTAHDALGFPLSGGFAGTATLTDTTGTISPTQVTFADGVAAASVVIAAPVSSGTITVTIPGGPAVVSNPFDVLAGFKLYLPLALKGN